MEITNSFVTTTRRIGAILLIGGGALAIWGLSRYEALPNYLRLALFLPLLFGVPMFGVNSYFGGWATLGARERGRAITWLLVPVMVLVGAIWWYLSYPTAKA